MIQSERTHNLAVLVEFLVTAESVTEELFRPIVTATRKRCLPTQAAWIEQLMNAAAWHDLVLVLIDIELPRWKLRRMIYDGGEWHCSLSTQREMPEWLDETAYTSHPVLALALIKGFVEALRQDSLRLIKRSSVPIVRLEPFNVLDCDNFV